jgi:hypothetical protein
LEWIAEQQGFLRQARNPLFKILPDYVFPGVANEVVATILAAVVGALLVLVTSIGMAYVRRRRAP